MLNRLLILQIEHDFSCRACPNVTSLSLDAHLLVHSKFIDNPSLISVFQRIKKIKSIRVNSYLLNASPKLVDRFPSLTRIELLVYTMDICVSIVDLFLSRLAKISFIQVYFTKNTLLDNPFTRDYVIRKRERFPDEELNEQMVSTGTTIQSVIILLS